MSPESNFMVINPAEAMKAFRRSDALRDGFMGRDSNFAALLSSLPADGPIPAFDVVEPSVGTHYRIVPTTRVRVNGFMEGLILSINCNPLQPEARIAVTLCDQDGRVFVQEKGA
jgi:hypothetical protein